MQSWSCGAETSTKSTTATSIILATPGREVKCLTDNDIIQGHLQIILLYSRSGEQQWDDDGKYALSTIFFLSTELRLGLLSVSQGQQKPLLCDKLFFEQAGQKCPLKLIKGGIKTLSLSNSLLVPRPFWKLIPPKEVPLVLSVPFGLSAGNRSSRLISSIWVLFLLYSGTSYSHRSFKGPRVLLHSFVPCCQSKTDHTRCNSKTVTFERRVLMPPPCFGSCVLTGILGAPGDDFTWNFRALSSLSNQIWYGFNLHLHEFNTCQIFLAALEVLLIPWTFCC